MPNAKRDVNPPLVGKQAMKTLSVFAMMLLVSLGCASTPSHATKDTRPIYRVQTTEQLLAAIGSNRIIELRPGVTYRLDQATPVHGAGYRWEKVSGGHELMLFNCSALTLRGGAAPEGAERAHVVTRFSEAYVLRITECDGITIENLKLGHDPFTGSCLGGVVALSNCENIRIQKSLLDGCGSEGLTLDRVRGLTFSRSIIEGCSFGILSAKHCRDLTFTDSVFRKNFIEEYAFRLVNTRPVVFEGCEVLDNVLGTNIVFGCSYEAFKASAGTDLFFQRGRIDFYRADHLARHVDLLLEDTVLEQSKR